MKITKNMKGMIQKMFNKKVEKTISIEGMKCEGCVSRVKNVLEDIKEVTECEVSLEEKTAKITLKKDIDDEIIKKKIENLGFKVNNI